MKNDHLRPVSALPSMHLNGHWAPPLIQEFEKYFTLKGTQAWEFFGSDFEFFTFLWLVIPNYYFLETFFLHFDQY